MPPRIQGVSLERFQREQSTAPWVSPFVFCKTILQKTVFWGMSFNRSGGVRKKKGVLPVGFVEWQSHLFVLCHPRQQFRPGLLVHRAVCVLDERDARDRQPQKKALFPCRHFLTGRTVLVDGAADLPQA